MKTFLSIILLLAALDDFGQQATLNETSVSYMGKTFKIGDIIQLGYGSGNNKDFVFVNYGKSIGNVNLPGLYKKADVNWSKAELEIVKLYSTNGVIWAKCNPLKRDANYLNKQIYINLEGAVDNNEIKSLNSNKQQKGSMSVTQKINAPTQTVNTETDGHDNELKKTSTAKKTTKIEPVAKKTVTKELPTGKSTSNGKLYFRTYMWTGPYGSSLELKWIFLGNDGTIVVNPNNGVNPINYAAELENNANNVGRYKIAGNKLSITWNNGKTNDWSLEFQKGEITAMDAGIVSRPKPVPANYKLNGQFAASAILPNVSSVHTLVFSNDGTFSLSKQGAVSTRDMSAISKSDSKGTYQISGNTLWLQFDNGRTEISTIYIWEQGGGKKHLVINQSSYPQEG